MKKILLALAGLVIVGLVGVGFVFYNFTQSTPEVVASTLIYEVSPGSSLRFVAKDLESKEVISSALLFRLYARLRGQDAELKVGEYALHSQMKPSEVLEVITSGKSVSRVITVAEGLNVYDVATLYEAQGFGPREDFLAAARNPKLIAELLGEPYESLEGYLFPETYGLTKFSTAEDLVRKMVAKFKETYAAVVGNESFRGMNRHEIVTLASIIEKETGAPEERPLISSVFHNRLQKGMRLQTDPTVLYGIWDQTGSTRMNITRNDLRTPTRYNTYTLKGLPFGPIANPGRDALEAAIKPAGSSFLFFVSRNDGTHVFTSTYEDHKKAVRRFQLDPKARAGKSWRDLNK